MTIPGEISPAGSDRHRWSADQLFLERAGQRGRLALDREIDSADNALMDKCVAEDCRLKVMLVEPGPHLLHAVGQSRVFGDANLHLKHGRLRVSKTLESVLTRARGRGFNMG